MWYNPYRWLSRSYSPWWGWNRNYYYPYYYSYYRPYYNPYYNPYYYGYRW